MCHLSGCISHSFLLAGSLFLFAGDSSGTTPPSPGGQVAVAAGTASPGGQHSSLQLLDTNPSGTGGDILLSSTGNIVLQSPVIVTASSTIGTAGSDALLVNAAATFKADTSVEAALVAHGNITLGDNNARQLTINAQTVFASSSGPITMNAPIAAKSDVDVSGTTVLGGNTTVGSNSSHSFNINANTIFSSAAAITANAPVTVNADTRLGSSSSQALTVQASSSFTAPVTVSAPMSVGSGSSLSALGNSVLGSDSSNTMTVFATANFSSGMSARSAQLYSNSSAASSAAALGFQRQNAGGAVSSGTTLGSVLFSGYDGILVAPTAQIRSQHTVSLCRSYQPVLLVACAAQSDSSGFLACQYGSLHHI